LTLWLALGCLAWAGVLAAFGLQPPAAIAVGALVFFLFWAALDG